MNLPFVEEPALIQLQSNGWTYKNANNCVLDTLIYGLL